MESSNGSARVGPEGDGKRLDTFLASVTGVSRNRAQWLISNGLVLVAGEQAKKNRILAQGDEISWKIPSPPTDEVVPQNIPLDIVFEDANLVVADKPPGMVMYPGPGHSDETLLNALLALYPEIQSVGGRGRQGIFHRLDRDTSGLVAVARTDESFVLMSEAVEKRKVERVYLALATGEIQAERGTIDLPMGRSAHDRKKMAVKRVGGRRSITHFLVKERFPMGFTLLEVTLGTGRTHQIRVHMTHIGHPLAGDPEYSRGRGRRELGLKRQFLHAWKLKFDHPVTGERMEFTSELPPDLKNVLEYLRRDLHGRADSRKS